MQPTLIGAYGDWAAQLLGPDPPALSFRRSEFRDVDAWRAAARHRLIERMAPPSLAPPTQMQTDAAYEFDGLHVERLRWQLEHGPPTEAVFLKPIGAKGRLPAVLGLHCHGGKKSLGWRKIARVDQPSAFVAEHHATYYGSRAWANELARRGYAVLVHDAFAFASRRVRMADCSEAVRRQPPADPDDGPAASINAYDTWAAAHEHIMAKSLFSAGTTWPGVFWAEDRVALDILASRDDVDPGRIGCGGLSGGGLRTCFLAGLDDRIRCAVAVGFMSTWRDFLLQKSFTHTWMTFVPLLPRDLDFPEILGLRVPAPTMVMNTTEDPLYTLSAVRESEAILRTIYAKAGAPDRLAFRYHPGGHRFDVPMQAEAFDWFDRWLKP